MRQMFFTRGFLISALFLGLAASSVGIAHASDLTYASNGIRDRLTGFRVAAHQGGIYHLRMNTLKQFKFAERAGVDIIEMDLRLSKDNVPVVFHDESLDSLTNCKGKVSDHSVFELKTCRFHLNSERIPTFEEVLEWNQGRVVVNAEFKADEVVTPAIRLVQKFHAYDWVYFQATELRSRYERARLFDSQVALLFAPSDQESLEWALRLNDDNLVIIELHENIRTAENISAIHKAGKLASENSWHFTPIHEFFGAGCTSVFERGIDIAVSNRPASCRRQRDAFSH